MLETQKKLKDMSIEYWEKYVFNTWQWWLNIATLLLPLILWWKLVDKKRLLEISVYGFFASVTAVFFDMIGETLVLWDYPYLVIPMDYILIDTDYSILPIAYMLIYQYFPSWKGFIIANTVLSALFSFVAEPLLVLLGLYEIHGWKYIYSFPIYVAIAILCKGITKLFLNAQTASTKKAGKN
jgi:hypothetical protein